MSEMKLPGWIGEALTGGSADTGRLSLLIAHHAYAIPAASYTRWADAAASNAEVVTGVSDLSFGLLGKGSPLGQFRKAGRAAGLL